MKCIQHILTKEVFRVSNDEAWSEIEGDIQPPMFVYVPKHVWKEYRKGK